MATNKNKKEAEKVPTKLKTTKSRTLKQKAVETGLFIVGVFILLTIISIIYSTAVVAMGTDGLLPKLMVAPQALFVGLVLLIACVKLSQVIFNDKQEN